MRKWLVIVLLVWSMPALAQVPPSQAELKAYTGLHAAAAEGDIAAIDQLVAARATIADDLPMLKVALDGGCEATNVTSPYGRHGPHRRRHLGHDKVVRILIAAKAPLDHVNNLGWTAVIESIVLGDGGKRHIATLQALAEAGANVNIADRSGSTPLSLARRRGYREMVAILKKAGAR